VDKNNTGTRATNGPSSEGEQEAKGRMTEATHPSTHRVPSWFFCSGRARLRPSRSAGRALFEHRADGPISAVETPSRLSRPPRNTASPSGPSVPQTMLIATAETAACGVPRTVAFGNEGPQGGCCDRGCGQRETPWPILQWHRKPLGESVLWHLMWAHTQRVAPSVPESRPPHGLRPHSRVTNGAGQKTKDPATVFF
jgi:hypothetical protein